MGLNRIDWSDSDSAYYLLQVADYPIGVQWDGINNYLRLRGYAGGSLDYQTTPVLTWTNGNVGIGTTNPEVKLDISGGIIRENGYELAEAATNNLLVNGDFEQGNTYGWSGLDSVVTGGYSGKYAAQKSGPVLF